MSTRQLFARTELRDMLAAQHKTAVDKATKTYEDNVSIQNRRNWWRAETEKKFKALAGRLKSDPSSVSDSELAEFYVDPLPQVKVRFGKSPEQTRDEALEKANETLTRRLARLDAIVPDVVDGWPVLHLTPTMLVDLFGL